MGCRRRQSPILLGTAQPSASQTRMTDRLGRWDNCQMSTTYKDADGIAGMRVAGRLASEVLDYLTPHVKPGVTTNELDKLAHDYIVNVQHAIPAPLNYQPPGYSPYPKSICTSINHPMYSALI
eukprot:Opistho-2@55800